MTPQTKMGLLICLSFLSVFLVLLIQTEPMVPPGDHGSVPPASHELQARRPGPDPNYPSQGHPPDPDRRAPPLEDGQRLSEQAHQIHPDSITNPKTGPESTLPPEERFEIYVVQKGDTLSRIARKFYGRSASALIDLLVEANKDRIKGKHTIIAGQELRIPRKT